MPNEGLSILTLLLVAAFTIERLSSVISFLLTWWGVIPDPDALDDDSKKVARARYARTAWHAVIPAVFVVPLLLLLGDFSFLGTLGVSAPGHIPTWFDRLILGVVLIGGSQQMTEFFQLVHYEPGGGKKEAGDDVEISGTLAMEDAKKH